jgi:putative peptidoglycan lipid II flippase
LAEPPDLQQAADFPQAAEQVHGPQVAEDAATPSRAGVVRFAGAAALIAGLTIASRIVGFGRTLVLGYVAGTGQDTITNPYLTANTVPNIIFEIVAGGALAALVVPLVAGAINRGDTAAVSRTGSALLTWVLTILTPVALVVAVAAEPIVKLAGTSGEAADIAAGMLRVFAIQIPLYGVSIVLGGLLQAHRRFAWPVLAPLVSSVVVVATYLVYGAVVPRGTKLTDVSTAGREILAVGTTLGVAALALCLVIPVWRLGLRLRPAYAFDADAGAKVRGLAWVGVVTVAAQQLSLFLAVSLINLAEGNLYIFTLAQSVYLVPWSVLALPVATASYPTMASAYAAGNEDTYRRTLASATRTVLLLSALAAALMIGAARPMAEVFAWLAGGTLNIGAFTAALIAFAPGLIGYGLFALHSRALYARHQNRFAALATLIGWGAVAIASVVLALVLPDRDRVTAVIVANSVGMTVLAGVLLVIIRRRAGRSALAGVPRAGAAAVLAGTVAGAAGVLIRAPLPEHPGVAGQIGLGMLSAVVVLIVFGLIMAIADPHDIRPLTTRMSRMVRLRRSQRSGQGE